MPVGQPPGVGIPEPLGVVAFQGHRLGLDTTVVMMAIAVMVTMVMGMSRQLLMFAASVGGHVWRHPVGMIRSDDADIQAGHHAKNH